MHITLTAADPRLGKFNEEGVSIRPALDFQGNVYDMRECSRFYFVAHDGTRYFLVIPALASVPELSAEIVAEAVEVPARKRKPDAE
jgi:hypothetical protein